MISPGFCQKLYDASFPSLIFQYVSAGPSVSSAREDEAVIDG